MKFHLADDLLSDTNAAPGSIYETGIYVITRGDTAAMVARRFEIPLSEFMAINPGLKPTRLYVGQKVRIYERKKG